MSWVAVAIGGSALIGAGAGIYSANRAADAQSDANAQALAYQQQTDARNQANIQPFLTAGNDANARLGASYADPSSVTSNPDYQFGLREGSRAMENSAAARGGLLSGNFARGITQFGQDYGTGYLQRYRSGLLDIAKMGAGAATGSGQNSVQSAGQVGNSFQGIGQANASGFVGGANAVTGSLSSGMNNYLFMNAMNRSSYGSPPYTGFASSGSGPGAGPG